jgi:hypothetical protein
MPEVLHSYGVRIFNIDRKTGVVLDTPFFLPNMRNCLG